jgi:transcriptional antiterminator RfaH
MGVPTPLKKWYALYTKPRHEFKAAQQISNVSIDFYLPTITVIKKWSDRKKKIIEPIIRCYIFVHVTEKERIIAVEQPSIVNTICFNGRPVVIPDWQIENLKIILPQTENVSIVNSIPVGTKVKITTGCFMGVQGVVSENNKGKWMSVSIDLLNRSILVKLPLDSVVQAIDNEE